MTGFDRHSVIHSSLIGITLSSVITIIVLRILKEDLIETAYFGATAALEVTNGLKLRMGIFARYKNLKHS